MTIPNSYYCFSEKGDSNLPSSEELDDSLSNGFTPVLFIDSCVCLHITKCIDYGKKATNINIQRLINLKEYLAKHPKIELNPFFGLVELSSSKDEMDLRKLSDLNQRVDFFKQIPFKEFRKFKYDFERDYYVLRDVSLDLTSPLNDLNPFLKNTYCSLLKIRSLATKSTHKSKLVSNMTLFVDWMINDLGIIRGIEYKLALNIFGGDTRFRKMIALDNEPKKVKKTLKGTCWDFFHSKFSSNRFMLKDLTGRNLEPYFLTSDSNLFSLYKEFNLTLIKDGGDEFTNSFILNSGGVPPHLEPNILEELNSKMLSNFVDRRTFVYEFNESKIDALISNLEKDNGLI